MVSIIKGDDVVNLITIRQKDGVIADFDVLEVYLNDVIFKTIESPVFPVEIDITREESVLLKPVNTVYLVGYKDEKRTTGNGYGTFNGNIAPVGLDKCESQTTFEISFCEGQQVVFEIDFLQGGGSVDSVNGKTGVVVLNANDILNNETGNTIQTDLNTVKKATETNAQEIENVSARIPTKTSQLNNDSQFVNETQLNVVSSIANKADEQSTQNKSSIDTINTTLTNKADLVGGKVPASQLPSFVDDVLEYQSRSNFPVVGENGKIYVALDTNKTYRWGGSEYVEISESLALGETAETAYAGNKGKKNAEDIAAEKQSRIDADDILQDNINSEALAREQADTQLNEVKADKFTKKTTLDSTLTNYTQYNLDPQSANITITGATGEGIIYFIATADLTFTIPTGHLLAVGSTDIKANTNNQIIYNQNMWYVVSVGA